MVKLVAINHSKTIIDKYKLITFQFRVGRQTGSV